MPDASIRIRASARSTRPTTDEAPRTCDLVLAQHGIVDLEAVGDVARIDLDRHGSRLEAVDGDAHGLWLHRQDLDPFGQRGDLHIEHLRLRCPLHVVRERSTVATKACAPMVADTSFDVRYRTSTVPRSPLSTCELFGWLMSSTRTSIVRSEKDPEKTSPVYRTVASRTADSFRCQLRSRMPT